MSECNVKNCPYYEVRCHDNCENENVKEHEHEKCPLYIEYNELINRKFKIDDRDFELFSQTFEDIYCNKDIPIESALKRALIEMGWYDEKKSKLEDGKIIKTENDYLSAINELNQLMSNDPEAGSPEADKIELLGVLIKNYEYQKYIFGFSDPIEAIRFRMEQMNLKQNDLIPCIGSKSKVSEILNKKRPLTLKMIRALHNNLKIPLESLIAELQKIGE